MSAAPSGPRGTPAAGERAGRERLDRLFVAFDRLTPDELAHVGFRMAADEDREPLLQAIDEAATRTGRQALVDEARELARDAVMRRYAAGTLHPTFVGLNWGLSQGTVQDRVGIAEALADAAAAAVVEDALDPEIAEALAFDARQVVGLVAGAASEGSFDRVVRRPADPDLGPSARAHRVRVGTVVLVTALAGLGGLGALGTILWLVLSLAGWSLDTLPVLLTAGLAGAVLGAVALRRWPARG